MFHRSAADFETVLQGVLALRQGVDDHVNLACLDFFDDIGAAFMYLAHNFHINAHGLDGLGRTFRRGNLEVQICKGLGQLLHLFS